MKITYMNCHLSEITEFKYTSLLKIIIVEDNFKYIYLDLERTIITLIWIDTLQTSGLESINKPALSPIGGFLGRVLWGHPHGCGRSCGMTPVTLRPAANSTLAFISFLLSFRAFFASLSVRRRFTFTFPAGPPKNTRITLNTVCKKKKKLYKPTLEQKQRGRS